jgi:anthranilate synthase component 1
MITFEEFSVLAADYNVVPLVRPLLADTLTPVSTYMTLRQEGTPSFILESVEPNEKIGRYSFIGMGPRLLLHARGTRITIREEGKTRDLNENLFVLLESLVSRYRSAPVEGRHGLAGGFVGYLGYNTIRHIEKIPVGDPAAADEDDAILGLFGAVIQFDHRAQMITIVQNIFVEPGLSLREQYDAARTALDTLELRLRRSPVTSDNFRCETVPQDSPEGRHAFEESVRRAKEFITEGEIFQVVLSRRVRRAFSGDLFAVYRALRIVNPSPYLFFLDFGDTTLVGSSPEVLVRSRQGQVELLPIAGTRRRGRDEEEDGALAEELLHDVKELAEHVMLVDLGRNDVGRIAKYGSVVVPVFKRIDRYSHVMHIVSEVRGLLQDGLSPVDVLKACFPAGTVSGAPKVRAMEIISELEPRQRGAYAGAVGYIGFDGTLDMCIAIRTIIASQGMLNIQAGAGIVADSVPEREYEETVSKAGALNAAITLAAAGLPSERLARGEGARMS